MQYIDTDVYTEAKKRIRHVIDTFDTIMVCFSGGKDSLCVLSLVEEVYQELGITEKIKVIFRDEELIPDDVIDFVREKAESGKYDFRYYAVPLRSQKYLLGEVSEYIQWDKNRRHIRKPPDYAIKLAPDDNRVFDQYSMDSFVTQGEKGRVALINGIRADESLVRRRACLNKLNENYINATKDKRVKMVKPIYDWSERDLFVYFYQHKIKYCQIYNAEMWNGQQLRVATPFHAQGAKKLKKIKSLYPKFYEQLIDVFPEMKLQAEYYGEFEQASVIDKYPKGVAGIKQYIRESMEDEKERELALVEVDGALKRRRTAERRGQTDNFGGYPLRHIFQYILRGDFKWHCMPKAVPSKQDIEYERGAQ